MARWTRRVGIFTIVLTIIAGSSAAISYLQWLTLEKSDETLRLTVEATQRPWLKVEPSFGKSFKPDTRGFSTIDVNVSIKNYGNSVATHAGVYMAIIADTPNKDRYWV